MAVNRRRLLVMTVVGLALATNGVWLLPSEGQPEYTYERAAVTVDGGDITYEYPREFERTNDLAAVACEPQDPGGRVCAFDSYLAANGSVDVSSTGFDHLEESGEDFVELDGDYYHRNRQSVSETTLAYSVDPVDPGTLLAQISQAPRTGAETTSLGERVATSRSETTTAGPEEVRGVGSVYEVEDSYYVVVLTDKQRLDRVPVPIPRGILGLIGGLLLVGAAGIAGAAWYRSARDEGAFDWLPTGF